MPINVLFKLEWAIDHCTGTRLAEESFHECEYIATEAFSKGYQLSENSGFLLPHVYLKDIKEVIGRWKAVNVGTNHITGYSKAKPFLAYRRKRRITCFQLFYEKATPHIGGRVMFAYAVPPAGELKKSGQREEVGRPGNKKTEGIRLYLNKPVRKNFTC